METSLDIQLRQLLRQRRGDWQKVAAGAGVSYSWLSKFANGHIDNPGFTTLKRLHGYLAPADAQTSGEVAERGGQA